MNNQVPPIALLPNFLVQWKVLQSFRKQVTSSYFVTFWPTWHKNNLSECTQKDNTYCKVSEGEGVVFALKLISRKPSSLLTHAWPSLGTERFLLSLLTSRKSVFPLDPPAMKTYIGQSEFTSRM